MKSANPKRGWPVQQGGPRQRGQALVYGLFVLAGGLTALFFLFNTGQLALEKDKLTTTADAVAYSGGVMRARALNFTAYTNRALVANEIAVAQMVSLASWSRYITRHSQVSASLGCETIWNWPAGQTFSGWSPLCMGLFWGSYYINYVNNVVQQVLPGMVYTIEGAKALLMGAQGYMFIELETSSRNLLRQVADANYRNNGQVYIDTRPLQDDYLWFDGGPFLSQKLGNSRTRFASVATTAAYLDSFIPSRNWSDSQYVPHQCGFNPRVSDRVDRTGGTSLVGLDEWRASDNFNYTQYYTRIRFSWRSGIRITCESRGRNYASGNQSAGGRGRASTTNWKNYSGLPRYLDMSDRALSYTPENSDPNKRDPRLRFSVMLTRRVDQTSTSEGRSAIKPAPGGGAYGVNQFKNNAAQNEYAAVSTAEVFFQRPTARADGRTELANVFNPFWQVHLVETSNAVLTTARLYQGVAF